MRFIRLGMMIFAMVGVLYTVGAQDVPEQTLMVGGIQRAYQVYVPSSVQAHPALVIVLHGGGSSATEMRQWVDFDSVADKSGFIVVYPDGLQNRWNDNRRSGFVGNTDADDVSFIAQLIDRLTSEYSIDSARVYVTGLSNGGFMTYRLACELTDRFAAFAAVAASLSPDMEKDCSPSRPVRMLIMNGTEDPLIPYNGGYESIQGVKNGAVLSVDQNVSFWTHFDQCTDSPNEVSLPDAAPDDKTRVYILGYTKCASNSDVVRYRIEGGGHTWPDGEQYRPENEIGLVSHDINASEVIWSFFTASSGK